MRRLSRSRIRRDGSRPSVELEFEHGLDARHLRAAMQPLAQLLDRGDRSRAPPPPPIHPAVSGITANGEPLGFEAGAVPEVHALNLAGDAETAAHLGSTTIPARGQPPRHCEAGAPVRGTPFSAVRALERLGGMALGLLSAARRARTYSCASRCSRRALIAALRRIQIR